MVFENEAYSCKSFIENFDIFRVIQYHNMTGDKTL